MVEKNISYNLGYVLKGLLILCVVFGHSISMVNSIRTVSWMDSPINILFTTFEMPGFAILSGYYLGVSLSRNKPHKVALKRLFAISSTLLIWIIVPSLIRILIKEKGNYCFLSILHRLFSDVVEGKLWYLFSYLFSSLYIITVRELSKLLFFNNKYLQYLVLVVAISLISFLPLIPGNSPFLLPFFTIGFWIFDFSIVSKKWFRTVLLVASILFMILLPFYTPEISFYLLSNSITSTNIILLCFRIVLSLGGCSFVYLAIKDLGNNTFTSMLIKLGKKSLSIYVLSMFIQEPMRFLLMKVPPLSNVDLITDFSVIGFGFLFCVLLIIICLLIDSALVRIKPIYKVLL